jgi:hypothetical protein
MLAQFRCQVERNLPETSRSEFGVGPIRRGSNFRSHWYLLI